MASIAMRTECKNLRTECGWKALSTKLWNIPILRVWEYRKDPAKGTGTEWPLGYKENKKEYNVSRKKVHLEGLC